MPLILTDVIHEELIQYKINPLNIQLIRSKSNNNIKQATYLVTVLNTSDMKVIKNIKYIYNISVTWEYYKRNNKHTQCYNCQSFGHGSPNCFKLANCRNCAERHQTKDCNINNSNKKLKCANCKGEHKANDPICKVYDNYTQKLNGNKLKHNHKHVAADFNQENHINVNNTNFGHGNNIPTYAAAAKKYVNSTTNNNEHRKYDLRLHQEPPHEFDKSTIIRAVGSEVCSDKNSELISKNFHTNSAVIDIVNGSSNCPLASLIKICDLLNIIKSIINSEIDFIKLEQVLHAINDKTKNVNNVEENNISNVLWRGVF